ncbi:MAG: hypothetical protein QOI59_382, partial [Gammaproteobacteria bacterium]|nr:hypothetical protein [Gammaproteobacteria bacterium]
MPKNARLPLALLLLCTLLSSAQAGSALTWSTDSSQPGRFMAVHGRRAATFGYSQNGLESWAYPVQIL